MIVGSRQAELWFRPYAIGIGSFGCGFGEFEDTGVRADSGPASEQLAPINVGVADQVHDFGRIDIR